MKTRQPDKKANRFPRLKSGDELTPRHINIIYAALEELARTLPGGEFAQHGVVATTSSVVTAASGDTLGKGTAMIHKLYLDGDDLKRGGTGIEAVIYNEAEGAGGEVASGRKIMLKRVNGFLLVDWEMCVS